MKKLVPTAVAYHSKMSQKEKEKSLDMVKSGKSNYLLGVDALNEGLDIPLLDAGISAAGDSSTLVFLQSIGRVIRKQEGRKSLFINLYANNTREKDWVKQKTSESISYNLKNLDELWSLTGERST